MVDVNDDAKGGFRRIEVLTGPGRRRRWSAEEKARIVADTLEPGARVSEGLCPVAPEKDLLALCVAGANYRTSTRTIYSPPSRLVPMTIR